LGKEWVWQVREKDAPEMDLKTGEGGRQFYKITPQ